MKTINIKEFGLTELTPNEEREISGGVIWIPLALAIAVFVSGINNFGDIREGLVDGFNGTPRH